MKPGKNSLEKRRARKITVAAVAALIAFVLAFSLWHYQQRSAQVAPALTGVASQMRHDTSAWTREEKDASQMLRDIHDANVAAIGVSPSAILVSKRDGSKYFVTDHNATFSHALLLGEPKTGDAASYQLVWLPDADIRTGGSRWLQVFDQTRDVISLLLPLLLIGGMVWFMRREMRGGASLLTKAPTLRFDDVIGANEAKAALADIRGYLSSPKQ